MLYDHFWVVLGERMSHHLFPVFLVLLTGVLKPTRQALSTSFLELAPQLLTPGVSPVWWNINRLPVHASACAAVASTGSLIVNICITMVASPQRVSSSGWDSLPLVMLLLDWCLFLTPHWLLVLSPLDWWLFVLPVWLFVLPLLGVEEITPVGFVITTRFAVPTEIGLLFSPAAAFMFL